MTTILLVLQKDNGKDVSDDEDDAVDERVNMQVRKLSSLYEQLC